MSSANMGVKRPRANDNVSAPLKKARRQVSSSRKPLENHGRIATTDLDATDPSQNYNQISRLIEQARTSGQSVSVETSACTSLCFIFSRLLSTGKLGGANGAKRHESLVTRWLNERLVEYGELLLDWVRCNRNNERLLILGLLMQLAKEEVNSMLDRGPLAWTSGLYVKVLKTLLMMKTERQVIKNFAREYIVPYQDVELFTLQFIGKWNASEEIAVDNIIDLLTELDHLNDRPMELLCEHGSAVSETSSLKRRRKEAEGAWMQVLRQDLSKTQRKRVISVVPNKVAPWFSRPELLMDFFTDSFSAGSSISLVALSGILFLIREKNLDYPQFYSKLYSLLNGNFLHSKHGPPILQLLDQVLASTHLSATLVASFIKKLSRLCLHAPPSGIIAIVPRIYNLLKAHPACTLMVHREVLGDQNPHIAVDPFLAEEEDPTMTMALESSLWEIETLQTHFHPNVAIIAKIISEQFTKQWYRIEDFSEHNYDSLLEAELPKAIKRSPIVEYTVPKTLFTKSHEDKVEDATNLSSLWDFA